MLKLLKGGECYAPDFIGKKDVMIVGSKIFQIKDHIPEERLWETEIIDCTGKIVCPGFIDQHVHITGGGGESGPSSRIPEIMLSEIIASGVSTVVGVLGVDSVTRDISGVLAKARALQDEGINAYVYTGSYGVPTASLTGKVINDIAYIDQVIGVGEIAISDYRSSHPTLEMLREISWEAKVGAMISGKKGVVHIHVGDGKKGLLPLIELVEHSDFPINLFVPTHLNRNRTVFNQAMDYARKGGFIDLTAGEKTGVGLSVPDSVEMLLAGGVAIENVTVSSDGNGSAPPGSGGVGGVGKVMQLYEDIKSLVHDKHISIDLALKPATSNVAKALGLYPGKGALVENSDADIVVFEKDSLSIYHMLVNGKTVIEKGTRVVKGTYEQ
ncbi:MAG: beta-aspartyl-peptidase [Clostridia bacterium]|nr:beta-aspartyl-peptidase [Clostridia bacterium]